MTKEEIIIRVLGVYPGAVIDVVGEKCNFELYVISDALGGMDTLQRQQSILGLFKDEFINGKLHDISIKAKTQMEQIWLIGLAKIHIH